MQLTTHPQLECVRQQAQSVQLREHQRWLQFQVLHWIDHLVQLL